MQEQRLSSHVKTAVPSPERDGLSLLLSHGRASALESIGEVGRLGHSQGLITVLHFYAAVFAYRVCLVNLQEKILSRTK